MNCQQIHTELPDVLQGQAEPPVDAEVRAHLVICRECARRAEEMGRVFTALEQAETPTVPPAYWPSVLPRIHDRIGRRASRSVPEWMRRVVLPASAALLVALIAVRGFLTQGPEAPGSISDALRQLPAGEVAQVQEQVESLLGADAMLAASTETPSDKEVLTELIPVDEQSSVYSRFDIETLVEGLNDQESTQLVALMEQQSPTN